MAGPAVTKNGLPLHELQGLIAHAYPTLAGLYLVFTLPDQPVQARRWLDHICQRITPANEGGGKGPAAPDTVVNVAFTAAGLRALGLTDATLKTFSREFQEGMATEHRHRLLGDEGASGPSHWSWGAPHQASVHGVLFLFAPPQARVGIDREIARAREHGLGLVAQIEARIEGKEHFGFHDGRSQPYFRELDPAAPAQVEAKDVVPIGELLLGHLNAYGRRSASPYLEDGEPPADGLESVTLDAGGADQPPRTVRDLGRNGTYVVLRQLRQHVKDFWRYMCAHADEVRDPDGKHLAAQVVGRDLAGRSLIPDAPFDVRERQSDIRYGEDREGLHCPLGAHVRRANPRDGLTTDPAESERLVMRHRLLRRGRIWGTPLHDSFEPRDMLAAPEEGERGMTFIALNSSIARQFEFVQSTWINNPKFNGLYNEVDPLLGPAPRPGDPASQGAFTIPRTPVRQRLLDLPRFVTTRGGAYLFMPSLPALRYLAGRDEAPTGNRRPNTRKNGVE